MSERHDAPVDDEQRRRQGPVGYENDAGDQGDEVRNVNERVRAEDREHVHVLLRVVQLVEAPEHPDAVVGQVGEPIARVHGDEDDGNSAPAWQGADPGQDEPGQRPPDDLGERQRQGRPQRHRDRRVQDRVEEILAVTAGEQRSALRRAQPLDYQEDPQGAQGERADDNDAQTGHRTGEVGAAPPVGPTDPDEDGGHYDDRAGREVDPRRQRPPAPARSGRGWRGWCDDKGTDGLVQDRHNDLTISRSGARRQRPRYRGSTVVLRSRCRTSCPRYRSRCRSPVQEPCRQ